MKGSRWPSHLVLLIGVTMSVAAALTIHKITKDRDETRFNHSTQQLQQTIENGLNKYLTLLDSVRAFAVARISMNPAQFQAYVEALNLRENYRGIAGLGLAVKVVSAQKVELVQKARAQGIPGFRVWPESDQAEICPLVILEPRDERNLKTVGYDLFAEAGRRATAQAAAENGHANATANTSFDLDGAALKGKRFLILVPVYRGGGLPETIEERRTNIAGFVQCAFETEELLQTIIRPSTNSAISLRIHDGAAHSADSLIYETAARLALTPASFGSTNRMTVANRPWTLVFASRPNFVSAVNPTPIVLMGGLALSGLLWGITVSQSRAREAAEQHAWQIQELNTHLERRVAERTAELEVAVEDLKEFSYSVSHDLRAPLRHIDGYVNLLKDNPAVAQDEKVQRHAKIISQAARQMGQLIDALLDFSRLGRVNLAVKPDAEVNEIVREVCQMLVPETEKRVIQWNIADLPKVRADRTLLRQVFANLLSNAVKYSTPRSEPVIEIGCEDREQEILFFVRDNGVGFDMTYADKLFSVFQRLHVSEEFEGTGIGLANVRKIVSRHGGRTWAEGAPGQGATFYFTLPKEG